MYNVKVVDDNPQCGDQMSHGKIEWKFFTVYRDETMSENNWN